MFLSIMFSITYPDFLDKFWRHRTASQEHVFQTSKVALISVFRFDQSRHKCWAEYCPGWLRKRWLFILWLHFSRRSFLKLLFQCLDPKFLPVFIIGHSWNNCMLLQIQNISKGDFFYLTAKNSYRIQTKPKLTLYVFSRWKQWSLVKGKDVWSLVYLKMGDMMKFMSAVSHCSGDPIRAIRVGVGNLS